MKNYTVQRGDTLSGIAARQGVSVAALRALNSGINPDLIYPGQIMRFLNQGMYQRAADEFLRWNKAEGKVMRGLTRRRGRERTLFLLPD